MKTDYTTGSRLRIAPTGCYISSGCPKRAITFKALNNCNRPENSRSHDADANMSGRKILGSHGGDYEEWSLLVCYAALLL
jgi:hypothetical protein